MPMIRYATVPVETVVSALQADAKTLQVNDLAVNITSTRIRTYTKGVKCVSCGLEGAYFAAEESYGQKYGPRGVAHLNLYAVKDGAEVMITSDHIDPQWVGGSDDVSNRQPMCAPCNTAKGGKIESDPQKERHHLILAVKAIEEKIARLAKTATKKQLTSYRGAIAEKRRRIEVLNTLIKANDLQKQDNR